ncbi:RNA-dependent RNA polymerase [Grifola frondosa partitivirus 1]|nr:RNA-dependent RNA polymerase [Grifola frondosa partitivirus 1]
MANRTVRDFLAERKLRIVEEWKRFQQSLTSTEEQAPIDDSSDIRRMYQSFRDSLSEQQKTAVLDREFQSLIDSMLLKNNEKKEPFEFSSDGQFIGFPENRRPQPGIAGIERKFHTGQIVSTSDEVPEPGYPLNPIIRDLITMRYPLYLKFVDKYVRPLGTTDATFRDFNREQRPSAPIDPDRKERVLKHVFKRLNATPYLPIHFVDTQFTKLPLHTGTGYFQRHSFWIQSHAKYSRPDEYRDRPTSKGYVINAFLLLARTHIHKIKETGLPFDFNLDDIDTDDDKFNTLIRYLNKFINDHATMLFTRNHISDKDGILKQRPVYAVDDSFILIEAMLTFPLLVMARDSTCCIMYGLETIRGGMCYIDRIARSYNSYFSIDWSQYDQRLPRCITDIYYTDFLESLIVINHGYQPAYEYPTYPDLTEDDMFNKMNNLLQFLHLWYNNMTFVTADGYDYRRTCAGVPSGLYNTQYLDSFGNIFLMIDGLIEYGCTDEEIDMILLFVMGDDNSGMTGWLLSKLEAFIIFFEDYSLLRYNMVLSKTKSVITAIRGKIEMLSYQCNYGRPLRPIGKLVAQLCYPERGLFYKFMSYRAIGVAYAAAGIDPTFHKFCQDIYTIFLPFAAEQSTFNFNRASSHLPGYLKAFDEITTIIDFTKFPTIFEVRRVYDHYHGPLTYAPKWNFAHFINAPNVIPPSAKTMSQYRKEHKIPRSEVPSLPIG